MKCCLLIVVIYFLSFSSSFAQDLEPRFKLYPTKNIWTFLKLDTSTGLIWQVQFSTTGDDYRFETPLNTTALVLDKNCPSGRFELYPTENIYNFVLIDTQVGTTYQVQWGNDYKSRLFVPLSPHSTLIWSHGYSKRKSDSGWSFVDMTGRRLPTEYFTYCSDFKYGFAEVELDDKWNLIDTCGNYLLNEWYESCRLVNSALVRVINQEKYNFYHVSGKFISSEWYDWIALLTDNLFIVEKEGKYNFINSEGSYLQSQWYDKYYLINQNLVWIKLDNRYNILDLNSFNLLSDIWFNDVESFYIDNNQARVLIGDIWKNFDIVKRKFTE